MHTITFLFLLCISWSTSLIPPKFQWKTIDFAWENNAREEALASGEYIPQNNMPTGLARWKDKLFITIPRWKTGVPSSLNYVNLKGEQQQPLIPYPSWNDAFISHESCCLITNSTVVSTFRVHVDKCDRLWVVDNGVSDMANDVKQIAEPAIVVFDLNTNTLLHRYILPDEVLRDSSVFTSIVVDIAGEKNVCEGADTYAYITDMGSNAIVVYYLNEDEAWRIEHPYFEFDPNAGIFAVGGVGFFWNGGVSSAALSREKKDGHRELYLHPTSSTKQFKMSTKLLKNKNAVVDDIFNGVEVVGDRGPQSQATACDLDPNTNVLFYTQLSKNGVGCWNVDKKFTEDNNPVIISDCTLFEFPNDIKVDQEGNLWVLSDKQSRFLYSTLDLNQINFRVMTAPVSSVIKGTTCEKGRGSIFKKFKYTKS